LPAPSRLEARADGFGVGDGSDERRPHGVAPLGRVVELGGTDDVEHDVDRPFGVLQGRRRFERVGPRVARGGEPQEERRAALRVDGVADLGIIT